MTVPREQRRLQAMVAVFSRHKPGSPELVAAREDYLAFQVECHAAEVVAQLPNLRREQQLRVMSILGLTGEDSDRFRQIRRGRDRAL